MLKHIDGVLFRNMVLCGAKFLEIKKEYVDSLNVFPVPDGDTGSNMYLTVSTALKEVVAVKDDDLVELAKALSTGALKGARGNSGVILSQIFKGMASVLCEGKPVTTKVFAKAMRVGTEIAYNAVTKPKEGTVLTVVRVMSEYARTVSNKTQDLLEFMQSVVSKGDEILRQTPDMLPVLKKAGVVDAGGCGLLCIFKGFYNAMAGIDIPDVAEVATEKGAVGSDNFADLPADIHELGEIEFGYCTEFFITNIKPQATEADIDKIREYFKTIGDCVLVIGDLHLVKVHVHTNNPGRALQSALRIGEIDKVKIENMRQQNRELLAKREAERKQFGIISVCAGMGLSDIFKDISVDYVIEGGQTMNPSVEDFVSAINAINAREIFVLPNNKNVILAAQQAKELVDKPVYVIPTIDAPQGIAAALAFNPEATADENVVEMTNNIETVKSGQVTHAVRTTAIDGLKVKEGDFIGLDNKRILCNGNDVNQVTCNLIDKLLLAESSMVTLYYGEDVKKEDAEKLAEELGAKHPEIEFTAYYGGQPHYYYIISIE